ncbi:hypothetical protein SAMN05421730_10286 [Anaerobium acetethylicum]|uniref:DUF4044 domain-containing protein n=1 Tax=Anaerobium acetethylicum TaxID=1619234 RepID=A0A1D3TX42_9FIRM|nr:hypothetical protein SAMN05421730_10286 [Anaerobium acetethylicum]
MFNFNNSKSRKMVSTVIIVMLVISMVLSVVLPFFS